MLPGTTTKQSNDATRSRVSPMRGGGVATRLRRHLEEFRRDESGVILAFSAFLILIMLIVGGIGIDLMRVEMARVGLQNTVDRAVLAAADLDQTLDPDAVVHEYFEKTGLTENLASVSSQQGINYKTVSATAQAEVKTQLLHMIGFETLTTVAAGTAKEAIEKVEVSLVLDVSGSMAWNSRLYNLKIAAKDFVDTMLDTGDPGDVTISLVPYSTQVNAGAALLSQYNVSTEHNFSHCIDFEANDFNTPALSTTENHQRTSPFDRFTRSEHPIRMPICPTSTSSEILPFSANRTTLKNQIQSLQTDSNTSIDIGMKWGVAMLDPSARPAISGMVASGDLDSGAQGHPFDYTEENVVKIVVLMSDGQNTNQYFLKPEYRSAPTDVWYYEGPSQYGYGNVRYYSVKHNSKYYYKNANANGRITGPYNNPYGGGSAVRLSYPELLNQASMSWIADYLYRDIWGRSSARRFWMNTIKSQNGTYTKNTRLDAICNEAKNKGVVVFTIGFEAPYSGQTALKSCASSDGHFFDVDGLEISDAFTAIASSISKLKLTQ